MPAANTTYDFDKAFRRVEDELMDSMVRNLRKYHLDWELAEDKQWEQWQAVQLKELEKYRKKYHKKFGGVFKDINAKIDGLLRKEYAGGQLAQEREILKAIRDGFPAEKVSPGMSAKFFRLNERKLEALIKATTNDMKKAEYAVLRRAEDQYRKIIYDAQVYANTGAGTYEKAVDMATKDFLASGINSIEYKNGARHTISDYADMAIRTAAKRAYLQGEGVKRQEWGIYTVVVNKRGGSGGHGGACPHCIPWLGKILIDDVWSGGPKSGKSPQTGKKYPLMSAAIAAGLYHPRCKDSHTTFFEGLSTPPKPATKQDVKEAVAEEKQEQRENYAQRQAEKYERLARGSLDSENQAKYEARAASYNGIREQRKHSEASFDNISAVRKQVAMLQTGGKETGGHSYKLGEAASGRDILAAKEYRKICKTYDVEKVAKASGFPIEDIVQIKRHLFFEKHKLYEGYDYLAPDYDIAVAWRRLREGRPEKRDIVLLLHERLESFYEKEYNLTISEAHGRAKKIYDWERALVEAVGEGGEADGLL